MISTWETTPLWNRTLAGDEPAVERLRTAYRGMRERVAPLAAEIHRDLPSYTVHDVSHLDALWEVAGTIVGPKYEINPLEAFVLGGAFLLHDLGMSLAAYPDRAEQLRTDPAWQDTVSLRLRKRLGRRPSTEELHSPPSDVVHEATGELLRILHAKHAERLPNLSWRDDETGAEHYLLEDSELRHHLGTTIGKIAHSHWWDADRLPSEFDVIHGPPAGMPSEWKIDRLKVACILRVADAAHIDARRAPRLLRSARSIAGSARAHWVFQGHLSAPMLVGDSLAYTSGRPFSAAETEAWWLAHDALHMVDAELRLADAVLSGATRPRFEGRHVAGVESNLTLQKYLSTEGWEPVDVRVRVGDVAALVERLGGSALYGDDLTVPLRELLQNGCDAVHAGIAVGTTDLDKAKIVVRTGEDEKGKWIEIQDSGIGMSTAVMKGPLLDFGESYWFSALALEENPGLASSVFEPTGRFGIGFFSVFMWGGRVRVTSRRADDAAVDTRVLEFEAGVRVRPTYRVAVAKERLIGPGTRVRVWPDGDVLERMLDSSGEGAGRGDGLAGLVAWLAPAASVDIHVDTGSGSEPAVKGNDWLSLPGEDLLGRLLRYRLPKELSTPQAWLDDISARLDILSDEDGTIQGRAAVVPRVRAGVNGWYAVVPVGVVTVGGFRSGVSSDLAGIIVSNTTTADRQTAVPIASELTTKQWANRQVAALSVEAGHEAAVVDMARVLLALGADISSLPVAESSRGWMTLSEIATWCHLYEEIVLVQDAAISDLRRNFAPIMLHGGVLALDESRTRLITGRRDWHQRGVEWPPEPTDVVHHFHHARTVVGAVVKVVAEAWQLTELQVWSQALESTDERSFRREIGRSDARVHSAEVTVLRRSSTGNEGSDS